MPVNDYAACPEASGPITAPVSTSLRQGDMPESRGPIATAPVYPGEVDHITVAGPPNVFGSTEAMNREMATQQAQADELARLTKLARQAAGLAVESIQSGRVSESPADFRADPPGRGQHQQASPRRRKPATATTRKAKSDG